MTQRKKTQTDDPTGEILEIEAELDQTRNAISNDLEIIGEKLSPERLKSEAKGALNDAKDAAVVKAKEKLHDAKDAAVGKAKEKLHEATDKARQVKDNAMESVSEAMSEAKETARHAGQVTGGFVRDNAVPLALIGAGIAWMIANNRRTSSDGWSPPGRTRSRLYEGRERAQQLASQAGSRVNDLRDQAGTRVHDLKERAGTRVNELRDRAGHAIEESSAKVRDFAGREYNHVRTVSRDLLDRDPLAVGAVALVAGVGVGLLLPATERENQVLGEARDRLIDEARHAASEVAHVAKDTARDLKGSISELGSSS